MTPLNLVASVSFHLCIYIQYYAPGHLMELPYQASNSYEAYLANPDECDRLSEIEDQIKGGTTVAAAIIQENILYIGKSVPKTN